MSNDYSMTADDTASIGISSVAINNLSHQAALYALCRVLGRIERGSLTLILPGMGEQIFSGSERDGPDAEILEIGCGWGGFMAYSAERLACRVQGITLSREQLDYTNRRMRISGLEARAGASLTDYRDTTGQYDAVVSIEMLEAVGEAHWPRYFETLYQRLKPGACAVVQVITIADDRFPRYRQRTDFIQRHVFPGGMLPSPSQLRAQAVRAGLTPEDEHTFGLSYARTLALWRERFVDSWPQIARQGFDGRFRRLWEYYLCYCETGFRTGNTDVGIYRFRRPG